MPRTVIPMPKAANVPHERDSHNNAEPTVGGDSESGVTGPLPASATPFQSSTDGPTTKAKAPRTRKPKNVESTGSMLTKKTTASRTKNKAAPPPAVASVADDDELDATKWCDTPTITAPTTTTTATTTRQSKPTSPNAHSQLPRDSLPRLSQQSQHVGTKRLRASTPASLSDSVANNHQRAAIHADDARQEPQRCNNSSHVEEFPTVGDTATSATSIIFATDALSHSVHPSTNAILNIAPAATTAGPTAAAAAAAAGPKTKQPKAATAGGAAKPRGDKAQGPSKVASKKVKDADEVTAMVKMYILTANMPVSPQSVVDALQSRVSKPLVLQSLEALTASGVLKAKDYKKARYYYTNFDTQQLQQQEEEGEENQDYDMNQSGGDGEVTGGCTRAVLDELRSDIAAAEATVVQLQEQITVVLKQQADAILRQQHDGLLKEVASLEERHAAIAAKTQANKKSSKSGNGGANDGGRRATARNGQQQPLNEGNNAESKRQGHGSSFMLAVKSLEAKRTSNSTVTQPPTIAVLAADIERHLTVAHTRRRFSLTIADALALGGSSDAFGGVGESTAVSYVAAELGLVTSQDFAALSATLTSVWQQLPPRYRTVKFGNLVESVTRW